jgi:TM2 domain-containing membrane protein YozV
MVVAEKVLWRGVELLALYGVLVAGWAMSPADKDLYEKLGLSETEWAKVQEMKLPLSKVHQLLESGISIAEYYRKPWLALSITEADYVRLRRAGHSDAEVRSMRLAKHTPVEWAPVWSFFVPGVGQIERGQNIRGWIMAGAGIGSIGLLVGQSIYCRRFMPLGLCLLVSDMLWSGIDMGLQVEAGPAARPVSGTYRGTAGRMRLCFSFY